MKTLALFNNTNNYVKCFDEYFTVILKYFRDKGHELSVQLQRNVEFIIYSQIKYQYHVFIFFLVLF